MLVNIYYEKLAEGCHTEWNCQRGETMLPLDDIPNSIRETIEELKNQNNIVGLSGGKDSMATCIILHKLGIPFKTITAEVWWKEGVTGRTAAPL